MSTKTVRINSKLYFDLFQRGGDKLIAVYSILKDSRNGQIKYYAYKSANNKFINGFTLLRSKTNLSLSVIQKYVPVLIDMGLCYIDKNGDFVLIGNKKLKTLYDNCKKLVPITIGKNMLETATNSLAVRVFSSNKKQQIQIKKKQNRNEILTQGSNPSNLEAYKKAKNLSRRGFTITTVTDKTVLSLQGFGVLKHGDENTIVDIKSTGNYWKKKLIKNNIIKSKREFDNIKKMSYSEYCNLKSNIGLGRNMTYKKGFLVRETVSSFSLLVNKPKTVELVKVEVENSEPVNTVIIDNKESYKKKPYLQFDMIDFWINGAENKTTLAL